MSRVPVVALCDRVTRNNTDIIPVAAIHAAAPTALRDCAVRVSDTVLCDSAARVSVAALCDSTDIVPVAARPLRFAIAWIEFQLRSGC